MFTLVLRPVVKIRSKPVQTRVNTGLNTKVITELTGNPFFSSKSLITIIIIILTLTLTLTLGFLTGQCRGNVGTTALLNSHKT